HLGELSLSCSCPRCFIVREGGVVWALSASLLASSLVKRSRQRCSAVCRVHGSVAFEGRRNSHLLIECMFPFVFLWLSCTLAVYQLLCLEYDNFSLFSVVLSSSDRLQRGFLLHVEAFSDDGSMLEA
ncbi:unnamed protein product, partial [Ectocarpus sp. 12 AP-2014]